jgi:hypothetical protein
MPLDIEQLQTQVIELVTDDSDDVTLEDLTQEVLNGSGVFDTLMRAMSNHLEKEHTANRITGDQYAQVYSAALTQVLQQSIAFLLGKGRFKLERATTLLELAKMDQEICVLAQKLVTEKANVMDEGILDPCGDETTSPQDCDGNYYFDTIQKVDGTIGRKNAVLNRQKEGYDDDYKTKTSRAILDAYRTLAANGVVYDVPSLLDGGIDYLMKTMKVDAKLQEFDDEDYLGASNVVPGNDTDKTDYSWTQPPYVPPEEDEDCD